MLPHLEVGTVKFSGISNRLSCLFIIFANVFQRQTLFMHSDEDF